MSVYDLDEQALILRCQQGDVSAFKQVYDTYGDLLVRLAIRMLGNRQDAEDAVQTTFVRLFQRIGQFRHQARFRTYLVRMTLNSCYDQLQSRRPLLDLENAMHVTANPDPETGMVLQQALERLPERMRACFILFAVEGWSQLEIAEAMHITVGAVKAHIYQAKVRLRALLPAHFSGVDYDLRRI